MNVIVRACVILAVMGGTLADLTGGPGAVAVDDSGCPATFATSLAHGGFNGILASEVRAATEFLAGNLGGNLEPTFGDVREFAVQMFSPEAAGVRCVRLSARLEQRQDNFQIVPPITEDDILSVLNSAAFDDCIERRACTVPVNPEFLCEDTSVGFSGNGADHGYAVEVRSVASGACDGQIPGGFLRCDETSPVSRNLALGDLMCAYDPDAGV